MTHDAYFYIISTLALLWSFVSFLKVNLMTEAIFSRLADLDAKVAALTPADLAPLEARVTALEAKVAADEALIGTPPADPVAPEAATPAA